MTKYSKGILEIVNGADVHMTAEQIFLMMKKRYPAIVMATVYNNLNSLCARGMIRRLTMEGQPDCYDRTLRHDHLVCRCCGGLQDVFIGDLTHRLREETGLDIDSYDLRISYVCGECRKNEVIVGTEKPRSTIMALSGRQGCGFDPSLCDDDKMASRAI